MRAAWRRNEGVEDFCTPDLDEQMVNIGGIERGERNVSLVNVVRIAAALGVDPRALMDHLTLT